MSTLATYDDVIATVGKYLFNRGDLTAQIPIFIRLCEAKMNRRLFTRQMEQRDTSTVDPFSDEPEFVSLPATFQTMRRVRIKSATGKPRLTFLTTAQLDDKRRKRNDAPGQPIWFTIVGTEMELCPTPDNAYELEMVYRRKIIPLDDTDNETNWLLDEAPDAYLYGTLMEAAPYLYEDERIAVWSGGLADVVNELNSLSEKASYNAGPLIMTRKGRSYS